MNEPLMQVFIINRAGTGYLDRCLDSLFAQEYPRVAITLLDPRGDADKISLRKKNPSLAFLPCNPGLAHHEILNHALSARRDDALLVAFINSSVELSPDWARAIVAAFHSDRRAGAFVSTLLFGRCRETIFSRGIALGHNGHLWEYLYGRDSTVKLPGSTIILPHETAAVFTREALERTGMFSRHFSIHFTMADFTLSMLKHGYRMAMEPNARAWEWKPVRIHETLLRSWYSVNRARLVMKHFPFRMAAGALAEITGELFPGGHTKHMLGAALPDPRCRIFAAARIMKTIPAFALRRCLSSCHAGRAIARQIASRALPPPVLPLRNEEPPRIPPLSSRALMGVYDHTLGPGWFETDIEREKDIPGIRYRWMSREASLSLSAPVPGETMLQLQLANPFHINGVNELTVTVNGITQGVLEVSGEEWQSVILPVEAAAGINNIRLEAVRVYGETLTGLPFDIACKVAEVSLLPANSPLLRTNLSGETA